MSESGARQSLAVRLAGRVGRGVWRLAGVGEEVSASGVSVAQEAADEEPEASGGRRTAVWEEFYRLGVGALPAVVLVQFLFGTALALQIYFGLTLKGYVGGVVAQNVLRWVGPLATALVLVGFAGAAITAEMASGKRNRAADGPDLGRTVCALAGAAPLLNALGQLAGLAGGWLISVSVLHVGGGVYWQRVGEYLMLKDVLLGAVKSACAGAVIAAVACRQGYRAMDGGEDVARAVQKSVVGSLTIVVVLECVWFWVFYLGV